MLMLKYSEQFLVSMYSTWLQNGNRYEDYYKIDGCENFLDDELAKLKKNKKTYELIANDQSQSSSVRTR